MGQYGSNIKHRKLNSPWDSQEYNTFPAGGCQARLKPINNLNIHTKKIDITLNIRQAIECCAQVKRLKYLIQNIFLHITHNYPHQVCIEPGCNAFWHFFFLFV